jgi:hypothetical protein
MPKNLYLPVNFEVKNYLPDELKKYSAEANYLLHLIECRRVFYKDTRSSFMPLKAKYLQNIMGSRVAKPVLQSLITNKVIECDNHYREGSKCLGYRLGDCLREVKFKHIPSNEKISKLGDCLREVEFKPIPCPPKISKRLSKQEIELILPIHLHLRSWIHQVTIDYEAAKSLLLANNAVKEEFVGLEMIQNRDFWFLPDKYGRVHTNITSMKSELRQFLRFGNKSLHFVDVVNSQPFFFAVVVANYSDNDSCIKSFNSFSSSSNSSVFQRKEREEGKATITICKFNNLNRLNRLDYTKDIKEYIRLTEQGQLYEQLQQLWNCDRETAKKQFFKYVLFCKKFDNDYRDKFKEQFPRVTEIMDSLKTSDYRHCGQMLQRAESAIVIHKACETLRLEYPQMPLITIHDSIGTTAEYLPQLKKAFQNAFTGLGINPSFK